jgi:DNA mismatch repair protein MutL
MIKNNESRRIHILRDSLARKIAAGEVIDRPFSVIRELLDNSLDAGAANIEIRTLQGGLTEILVLDDGTGMGGEDLEICCSPHATSKITSEDDLLAISSLGFRGEALASIAAVSRLEITSRMSADEAASKLTIHGGKRIGFEAAKGNKGSHIRCGDLFYNMPARKRFLKRASAESAMCRNIVLEKSLPFYEKAFRFFTDNKLKTFLPPASRSERILAAFPENLDKKFIEEEQCRGEGFEVTGVFTSPDLYRKDRKFIQVFINNRRVWEYPLVQAVEYGYSNFLPGGSYPYAFLFIKMDPELVDFNIHPAKKEVRLKQSGELHHAIVTMVKEIRTFSIHIPRLVHSGDQYSSGGFQFGGAVPPVSPLVGDNSSSYTGGREHEKKPSIFQDYLDDKPLPDIAGELWSGPKFDVQGTMPSDIRYLGRIMGVFLLAEYGERLFIIDQHAAHERLLMEHFRSRKTVQTLLIPIDFDTEPEEEVYINAHLTEFKEIGITLNRTDKGDGDSSSWQVTQIPESCSGEEDHIIEVLKGLGGASKNLETEFYAGMACRAAVKDGDPVDNVTALKLIEGTFQLDNARCPHGRPIWYEISKNDLFKLVGRT